MFNLKKTFALLCVLSLAPLKGLIAAEPSKPNIVFIFADDWGWGDLSCHGHKWLKTPNIDKFAREGTDFQQFNVLNPVCSPSRTAAMTGHYPARYCIHQHFAAPAQNHQRNMPDWLDPKAPTLPRFLKEGGYRTGHFGKWHLSNAQTPGAPKPEKYGIDEFAVFNGGQGWPVADLHATAENTVAFIKANKTKPFFVNVWLHESHTPHVPTPESMEKWKHLDKQKQVYSAVITDGDNAVGKILDAIKSEGLSENTIVIFSSDNGPESTAAKAGPNKVDPDAKVTGYDTYYSIGETGGLRGRKRSLFEGGVRVPFIVRWPGHTPADVKNTTTVFTVADLLPTLCASAGVKLPAEYKGDGENLLDALKGKVVIRNRPIFWEWLGNKTEPNWWPRLAVREGDWKLLLTDDAKRVELYRLNDDRAESKDVAKENPDIVARLTKLALDWKATLPKKPNPECLTPMIDEKKANPEKPARPSSPEKEAKPELEKYVESRQQVLALAKLTIPPKIHPAKGFAEANGMKAIFFEGLTWKGKTTRVFAWLGMPAKREGKVPGMVLVHGGGGTAHKEWVKKWNDQGFAAISIAVEGQTDDQIPNAPAGARWKKHNWPGPTRSGIYGDSAEPLADQWMYHAVADCILANSLLRSLPEVDADKVGLSGFSWGGVITSTVIGIDSRLKFAIPVYGCGHLFDCDNQYAHALRENGLYRHVWDPMVRMDSVKMPVLWLSWPEDKHFAMDCLAATYNAAPGPHMLTLIPKMGHGGVASWKPAESYAFAKSIVADGKPWCQQTRVTVEKGIGRVEFTASKTLDRAVLISTTDTGFTGDRKWVESPATLEKHDKGWVAQATMPVNTKAWFINVRSGELTASSDYQNIK